MKKILFPVFALLTTWAPAALAHEGHGDPRYWHSMLHYFLEPVHAVAWGTVLVLVAAVLVIRARRARRNPR